MSTKKDFYTSKQWRTFRAKMLKALDHVCTDCNREVFGADITLDHILPLSKYPDLAYEPSNIRVMCRKCNGNKRDLVEVRNNYFNPRWLIL